MRKTWTSYYADLASRCILFKNFSSNNNSLNFTCPFINLRNPCIPVMPLCRHICDVTHSAEYLNRLENNNKCFFTNNVNPFTPGVDTTKEQQLMHFAKFKGGH